MEDFEEHTGENSFSRRGCHFNLHSQAWGPGTIAAYNSAWGKWVGKNSVRSIDPLELVTEFSAVLYRTINTYRSAILKNHALVHGHRVEQYLLIFNMRSPRPKHQ